jgi:hypothetical protein
MTTIVKCKETGMMTLLRLQRYNKTRQPGQHQKHSSNQIKSSLQYVRTYLIFIHAASLAPSLNTDRCISFPDVSYSVSR